MLRAALFWSSTSFGENYIKISIQHHFYICSLLSTNKCVHISRFAKASNFKYNILNEIVTLCYIDIFVVIIRVICIASFLFDDPVFWFFFFLCVLTIIFVYSHWFSFDYLISQMNSILYAYAFNLLKLFFYLAKYYTKINCYNLLHTRKYRTDILLFWFFSRKIYANFGARRFFDETLQHLPSLFIPICRHFLRRQAWHWFRCALSTMHRPVPAWHLFDKLSGKKKKKNSQLIRWAKWNEYQGLMTKWIKYVCDTQQQ